MLPVIEALSARSVLAVPAAVDASVAENLVWAAEQFDRAGATTAIEFVAGRTVSTLGDALRLVDLTSGGVQLVIDVWHFGNGPDTEDDLAAVDPASIGFIQLCDATEPLSDDLAHEMRYRRTFPGEGRLDVRGFCRVLRDDVGYDGVASIEILSEDWRDTDLETYVRRSLESSRSAWFATITT